MVVQIEHHLFANHLVHTSLFRSDPEYPRLSDIKGIDKVTVQMSRTGRGTGYLEEVIHLFVVDGKAFVGCHDQVTLLIEHNIFYIVLYQ